MVILLPYKVIEVIVENVLISKHGKTVKDKRSFFDQTSPTLVMTCISVIIFLLIAITYSFQNNVILSFTWSHFSSTLQ